VKILLTSHRFDPDVGGIETVSMLLAREFTRRGHEVRVVTGTLAAGDAELPFPVIRAPGSLALLGQAGWCDVFFQNNISLQTLWAGLLRRRPVVVAHHTWIGFPGEKPARATRLKRFLLRCAQNISVSDAVAEHIGTPSTVIGNPYPAETFRLHPEEVRSGALAYLGRLVSDKGVDLLLDALGQLAARGLRPRLTIIGSGPEEAALREQTARLGLGAQVEFAGAVTGEALARLLNRQRILVVPSRWVEPFGLVALEAIACGCVVVGSDRGGLPGAIGPCGLTFPSGDATALAATLARLLGGGDTALAPFRTAAGAHLAPHTGARVADAYLQVLTRAAA